MLDDLLITGGSGLLGSALRRLCPDAMAPSRTETDLTDLMATRAMFSHYRPRRVLHLAALVGGVRFNQDHQTELYEINCRIDANVLVAAQASGVERLVGVLSSCAFHYADDATASEADLHAGPPYSGSAGYARAKRQLDLEIHRLFREHGCRYSTIAPVTMFGSGAHADDERGHVIASLVTRALDAKRDGQPLAVWGTGQAVRQFVSVDDVARVLLQELDRPLSQVEPDTVIVAPDDGLTIADLATRIARNVGLSAPLTFTGELEGQRIKRLISTRFNARFPGFAFTPFDAALAATCMSMTQSRAAMRSDT